MVEFQKQHGPVTEEQVARAEAQVGSLPTAYRRFLLETGGGSLAEPYEIPGFGGSALLTQFYDVESLVEMQGLGFNEVIPKNLVAIGRGGGGALSVKVSGDDVGSVWWADYDQAEELGLEEPSEQILKRLADDLDVFLAQL